jgi:hypothetical protein
MNHEEVIAKRALANKNFTPSAPVNAKDLFFGRFELVGRVVDAISRTGQHVIMFGERGVGKTSLGNVIHTFLPWGKDVIVVRANCSSGETFSELWKSIFRDIELKSSSKGLKPVNEELVGLIKHLVDKENNTTITPNDVRFVLTEIPYPTIIVIDEVDRITDPRIMADLADTIKALSDYATHATLILIGVGKSIEDLVQEHASVTRALSQIAVPRMSPEELQEIIAIGMKNLSMEMPSNVAEKIVRLSQGLPHYTHLLALQTTLAAIDNRRPKIEIEDYEAALRQSITDAQQSIRTSYHKAVTAPRGKHYSTTLLACALAKTDEISGTFAPADVGRALKSITGKDWPVSQYTKHLHEFASEKQGSVLEETGTKGRYKYKFKDPMMQPFIVLKGVADGKVKDDEIG